MNSLKLKKNQERNIRLQDYNPSLKSSTSFKTDSFFKYLNIKSGKLITWDDFEKIDIRSGTILTAKPFEKAKKPAYQLEIDFGTLGVKKSSAQITHHYAVDELIGKQIIAVVNFPPKQIANFFSECLVLGVYDKENQVILLQPTISVENGSKIG